MNQFKLEYLYTIDGYITFSVQVSWNDFSGKSNFCISENLMIQKLKVLRELYNNLQGDCRICDYDSDDYIIIGMKKYGHIIITGQLGGSYNETFLKYQYLTDQVELDNIINCLECMLKRE